MDIYAMRAIQLRLERIISGQQISLLSGTRDDYGRVVFRTVPANQMIFGIGDDDVAVKIDSEMLGSVQIRHAPGRRTNETGADDGPDFPIRSDHPQRIATP